MPFSLSCASVSASMPIVANSGYNTVNAQLFEVVNAGTLTRGSLQWAEFSQRLEQLSSFLLRRSDGSRMLNHTSFREWLMWREEGQDDRFLCDPRYNQPEGISDKWREKKTGTDVSHRAVCVCFQEWPHSPVLLALQTGWKADPTADTGARASHPEGAHLQGEHSHTKFDTHARIPVAGNHTRRFSLHITNI